MSEYLPDLSKIPDSEAKRKVENLAHEFEFLLEKLGIGNLPDGELQKMHAEANKVWYSMNAQVGKLFEQERGKLDANKKFYITILISIIALIISIISICIK